MKVLSFSVLALLIATTAFSQQSDEQAVRKLLSTQSEAWNKGNIDEFMKGYWKDDSLMFIGKSGITYGYKNTLNNYKKNYGNADLMGKLAFTLIKIQRLSPEYYYVVGKWQLARKAGDVSG